MIDNSRLGVALAIEDVARRLEDAMLEQNKLIGDLLAVVQEYADLCDNVSKNL